MEIKQLYNYFLDSSKLSTDSRKIEADCMYFALKGDHFDGNKFAQESLSKGAKYAIVDDPALANIPDCIYVNDSLKALQQLGNYHRKQFNGLVIGITGSNGKTTTKELIYSILSKQGKTLVTKGNLNNHIGVPLTLLSLELDEQFAIIEMGANHQGEIDFLCNLADPQIGIITNVGKAHLDGFGGFEGVKKGKSELYHYLNSHKGLAIVNADEKELRSMIPKGLSCKFYGSDISDDSLDYKISGVQLEPQIAYEFIDLEGNKLKGNSSLQGRHNFQNIKTAIALALHLEVNTKFIDQGVSGYQAESNRSQLLETKTNRIYLDAYNANPDSMQSSLASFFKLQGDKKVVILGDMLELGSYSLKEHQRIYDELHYKQHELLFLVGSEFKATNAPDQIKFDSTSDLKDYIAENRIENALIFLKASRGIQLEGLIEVL